MVMVAMVVVVVMMVARQYLSSLSPGVASNHQCRHTGSHKHTPITRLHKARVEPQPAAPCIPGLCTFVKTGFESLPGWIQFVLGSLHATQVLPVELAVEARDISG
ncbi:hypothetical protein E2C01_057318 [Portunus trituberculatus]|uniref:Secreted protein n=1 Tax=Portunus trituberculatus TaxID=210409 RepID=A0A5B7H317_PORTR|nr:hypothetical protein [Portunus trituberculatus]